MLAHIRPEGQNALDGKFSQKPFVPSRRDELLIGIKTLRGFSKPHQTQHLEPGGRSLPSGIAEEGLDEIHGPLKITLLERLFRKTQPLFRRRIGLSRTSSAQQQNATDNAREDRSPFPHRHPHLSLILLLFGRLEFPIPQRGFKKIIRLFRKHDSPIFHRPIPILTH